MLSPLVYYILHVAGGFLLVGYTFQAFAAPQPDSRKQVLMMSGISSLVMFVAGFALLTKMGHMEGEFPLWAILKLVCWLVLSMMAGMAYRRPALRSVFGLIALAAIVGALYCVYYRPTF